MIYFIKDSDTGVWVDMSRYIKRGGLKIHRGDMHTPGTGRKTANAKMYLKRVAIKYTVTADCMELEWDDINYVMKLIKPEWIEARIRIPGEGVVEGWFYSNNIDITLQEAYKDGREVYKGFSYPLIME